MDPLPGGSLVVLGFGAVGQCLVSLLSKIEGFDPSRVSIIDAQDNRDRLPSSAEWGSSYSIVEISRVNLEVELGKRVKAGDVLVNVAWNIDACTIIQWCHENGVHYLDTSVEEWDPYDDIEGVDPRERTLYVRHMKIRAMQQKWQEPGPSSVVEHGANPGLVSHFAKMALWEIAQRMCDDGLGAVDDLRRALELEDFAALCLLTGTKVIHISERDTQVSSQPKEPDEFVNTWSIEGLYEEGIAPAEVGWGTHERTLPEDAFVHEGDGPRNQICLARPGIETRVRSWVPNGGPIIGMVIRHGEAFTMSEHLTSYDDEGRVLHRPTVHYAYCPTDAAIASIHELLGRQWRVQSRRRVMNDDIVHGEDELGVLLMGHPYGAWWCGTQLTIEETRRHVYGQNATTLQVAASILGVLQWMKNHPNEGLCVPDQLPWRDVLDVARPYLGNIWSGPVTWDPVSDSRDVFGMWRSPRHGADPEDPWQFANFLV
jgi:homospermidine synthase